ncbi:uncharacterized protein LY79DRAFT_213869 [Colletotrichum navitas]|uniref:Uncharacterized protein n=1 Tax=Colletotrichum navitas TaxID=681940 RepID=A0AAD8PZK2_9PEZI|nr:uncharacterized protein LY79DRAFT_213869 [Colletotrichum navitas]KAK1590572.1 hypothetical protein LY79DRAFT_213869 [Colletotrichum navitas]
MSRLRQACCVLRAMPQVGGLPAPACPSPNYRPVMSSATLLTLLGTVKDAGSLANSLHTRSSPAPDWCLGYTMFPLFLPALLKQSGPGRLASDDGLRLEALGLFPPPASLEFPGILSLTGLLQKPWLARRLGTWQARVGSLPPPMFRSLLPLFPFRPVIINHALWKHLGSSPTRQTLLNVWHPVSLRNPTSSVRQTNNNASHQCWSGASPALLLGCGRPPPGGSLAQARCGRAWPRWIPSRRDMYM